MKADPRHADLNQIKSHESPRPLENLSCKCHEKDDDMMNEGREETKEENARK